jgi:paraquat-inducible protein B
MKRSPLAAFQSLVTRGLRARLQTGSLLTGQLYVDLDMQPKSPPRLVAADSGLPELPTIRGNVEQMTVAMRGVLDKLDQVDFASIGRELEGSLKGANAFANGKQLDGSLADLAAALASMRSILHKVESRAEPLTENLDKALVAARGALEKSQVSMNLVNEVLDPESPSHDAMMRLARELTTTARSIRTLVDMLERNPQSLILGKKAQGEPQ